MYKQVYISYHLFYFECIVDMWFTLSYTSFLILDFTCNVFGGGDRACDLNVRLNEYFHLIIYSMSLDIQLQCPSPDSVISNFDIDRSNNF